ncbi:MAG: hypothetical protein O2856_17295 [Planctomycetota bacterium]|nr:hypothetical protein [Planctomycetota bacterium]
MTGVDSAVAANQSTLVQFIEIWIPDDDGQTMHLMDHARLPGGIVDSGRSKRCVRNGECVAGLAWNQRSAVIFHEAPSELLQRIGTQNGLNLTSLIAYPIMRGHDALSVVVFGISDGPGAFEIWSRDDRDELSISSSYYQGLKSLEFISRYVRFPKGAGLPGKVWKSGQPKLAGDLTNSATFMRSCEADETVLQTGLALPVGSSAGNCDSVLLLLSAEQMPIANAFAVWAPGSVTDDTVEFQCVASDWNSKNDDWIVREAWTTGGPVLSSSESGPASQTQEAMQGTLAMPVYRGTVQDSVVVLVFICGS